MAERSRKGILIMVVAWIVLIAALALGYRFIVKPMMKGRLVKSTSSQSQYHTELEWLGDGFSGYAILRSQSFENALAKQGIRWAYKPVLDYQKRVEMLAAGKVPFAVFPIGSYIKAGVKAGNLYPASQIVGIDETVGADAIVAFKSAVPNIDALNCAEGRIVLPPSSPSETIAQVMVAQWALDMMPTDWAIHRDDAEAVYREMMSANRALPRAYVLWEPYVSLARKDPDVIVLLDSSQCKGCILDGLYAERSFLGENPDLVKTIVEAYLKALYYYSQQDRMVELIVADAKAQGESVSRQQAEQIAAGIRWTNCKENYAYFNIEQNPGIRPLEDVISFLIEKVLLPTNALAHHPLPGKEHTLYYDGILRALHGEGFHPAKRVNLIDGAGPSANDLAGVRGTTVLPALTEAQWQALVPSGSKRIAPIEFRRGSADISAFSETDIETAAEELKVLSDFYIKVKGHTLGDGDSDANKLLAKRRADAVVTYLKNYGIPANRLRAETAKKSKTDQACVVLELAQAPY